MDKTKADLLWVSILEYAECTEGRGAEGNSGEFHDEKEWNILCKEADDSLSNLKKVFAETTGWMPEYKKQPGHRTKTWVLEVFNVNQNSR